MRDRPGLTSDLRKFNGDFPVILGWFGAANILKTKANFRQIKVGRWVPLFQSDAFTDNNQILRIDQKNCDCDHFLLDSLVFHSLLIFPFVEIGIDVFRSQNFVLRFNLSRWESGLLFNWLYSCCIFKEFQ